jgi:hypothetical protein
MATRLVALRLTRTVSAPLDLGVIALDPGFVLSGTVRSFSGIAQSGSDVDVRLNGVGKILTCNDNTNASGVYAVVVPGGTMRVVFHPPSYTLGLGTLVERNVVVSADRILDATLPACDAIVSYGNGLAGTGGFVPQLSMSGGVPALDNDDFAFELQNGRGGAQAFLMVGFAPASIPSLGGTVLVAPQNAMFASVTLGGGIGVGGAGSLQVPAMLVPDLVGLEFYSQFFVRDPLATQGWAFSNAVAFRVCR